MASFDKLETTYLSILRAAILVIASLILVFSVVFGIAGLSKIQIFSFFGGKEVPKVETGEVLKKLNDTAVGAQGDSAVNTEDGSSDPSAFEDDPNAVYYNRSVNAVVAFLQSYSNASFDVKGKENIYREIKNMSEKYEDEKAISSFATGMAETLESALKEKSIIDRTVNRPAGNVLREVVGTYVGAFNEQYQKINAEHAEKEMEKAEKKTSAVMQLSMAGGSFLIFLLLVFLMIFVKIELNLREMAKNGAP